MWSHSLKSEVANYLHKEDRMGVGEAGGGQGGAYRRREERKSAQG